MSARPGPILALETSSEACSVALGGEEDSRQRLSLEPRGHLAAIPGMVSELLAEAELGVGQLSAVACSIGPGSFTGLRIGIAYAQSIAQAADLPMVGLSSLECLAVGAQRRALRGRVLVGLDARMGELYLADFELTDEVERLSPDRLSRCADELALAAGRIAVGPAAPLLAAAGLATEEGVAWPEARDLLGSAQRASAAGATVTAAGLVPAYLRDEVTG